MTANAAPASLNRANGNGSREPVYLQLANRLAAMIRDRSLRPGDRVPSVRQFSSQQRVSVPTALQAYATLETRGLIEARPQSGFYVRAWQSDATPEPLKPASAPRVTDIADSDVMHSLMADHSNSKLVPLGAALPAPALLAGVKLSRIMAAIGRRLGPAGGSYDVAPGSELLRREIARRSLDWGCALKADDFIVTIGATEAVYLALRATCRPGDTVAVESPTYFGLARALRELQLRALPIPVESSTGMDLDALARALRKNRVAACVSIPSFHNPVGFSMPDERRRQLVEMLARRGVPLIEDDIYGDLNHEDARPRCLKAFDPDGSVILCSSYSKTLAPGYRVGYIAAGRWHSRVLALKHISTLSGSLLPTLAVTEFLKNGGYDRYLRSVRRAFQNQVARMREAVVESFPSGISLTRPKGGFLLWCELPRQVDSLKLFKQARAAGISIAPGPLFSHDNSFRNFIRLNCGNPWDARTERSIAVLGHLVHKLSC